MQRPAFDGTYVTSTGSKSCDTRDFAERFLTAFSSASLAALLRMRLLQDSRLSEVGRPGPIPKLWTHRHFGGYLPAPPHDPEDWGSGERYCVSSLSLPPSNQVCKLPAGRSTGTCGEQNGAPIVSWVSEARSVRKCHMTGPPTV